MQLKQLLNKPSFCYAPWFHLVLTQRGSIRPCNDFYGDLGCLYNNTLEREYNSKGFRKLRKDLLAGRLNKGCMGCREKEKKIGFSRRISIKNNARQWGLGDLNLKLDQQVSAKNIIWLDVRLSNLCNLKCRHCYPALSTKWLEDMAYLKNTNFIKGEETLDILVNNPAYRVNKLVVLPKKIVNDVVESTGSLRRLEFKGGEPFLQKELYYLLEIFQKRVKTSKKNTQTNNNDTRIILVTNGTIVPQRLINIIPGFSNVDINFSIEGVGRVYKYIRGGDQYDLDNLKKNVLKLDILPNVKTSFRITCLAYNLFEIPKIYEWIKDLPLKSNAKEIMIENYVVKPEFLNIMVIPYHIRLQAQKELKRFINQRPPNLISPSIVKFSESLGDPNEFYSKQHLTNFITFTKALDRIRGENVKAAIPQYKNLFN